MNIGNFKTVDITLNTNGAVVKCSEKNVTAQGLQGNYKHVGIDNDSGLLIVSEGPAGDIVYASLQYQLFVDHTVSKQQK